MKKITLIQIFLILLLISISSCSAPGNKSENGVKTKIVEGVPHVYNPSVPLKGIVKLELEKILEIDSKTLKKENPPSINQFVRSSQGRTYLCDNSDFKIYIFDETGKFLNKFLEKGEGPGEFSRWYEYSVQPVDNDIWLPGSMKIARFNPDGKFIEEIKFNKSYHQIEILDENRFIANYYIMPTNQSDTFIQRTNVCAIIDRNENILKELAQEVGAGTLLLNLRLPGRNMRIDFGTNIISPLLLHSKSLDRNKVYLNRANEYVITVKNLSGETQMVIHRDYENILLKDQDRKDIVDEFFFRQPPEIKKAIQDNLPAKFIAILRLEPLSGDYLAVFRLTGRNGFKIDIFDPKGQYIYELGFPQEMERRVSLQKDIISVVSSIDDRDVYRAYRIKNLPEIF